MKERGWNVKEHHFLETAWEATFGYGQGGRVIGINSEVLGITPPQSSA
jgi:metal-dependent amidase/aminoacylase/carboxypeptidase family protein